MMKNLVKLSGAAVVFLSVFLAAPIKASGQSNWLTKVTLGEVANGEPGLAEFKGPDGVDRLILTWGGSGNNYFNSLVSTDGVNWTNKYTLRSSPLVAYDVTGGIGMTGSTSCGYAYAAFRDGASGLGRSSSYYGHIWVARTQNGSTWSSFYNVTPTWSSWSAPSLRGDNSSLPIGAAFAHYYGATGTYYSWKEKFNCDLSGPALVENEQPSGGS